MGGLVLQQGEGREESSDHAGGGKTMGAPCFEPGDVYGGYHGGVLQKMKQPVITLLLRASANRIGLQVSTGFSGIRFTTFES
jgi:hypothetical protein